MRTRIAITGLLCALAACSDDDDRGKTNVAPGDPFAAYDEMNVNVIGADPNAPTAVPSADGGSSSPSAPVGGDVLVGSPTGAPYTAEVCIDNATCAVPAEAEGAKFCDEAAEGGGPVDLIYVDGELVSTICYPPSDDPDRPVEVVSDPVIGDFEVAQNMNNTTVVFDEATNGVPIEGDITIDGNNVAVYGNGPDETIIDGNVDLDGNTLRLRGVTITGNLILRKNNVAVVLSRVLGNIMLTETAANGSVFAENDIFGNFTSGSNGNIIVGNDVLGTWEHTGNGNTCDRNARFMDLDGDELVDDDERGELLPCP